MSVLLSIRTRNKQKAVAIATKHEKTQKNIDFSIKVGYNNIWSCIKLNKKCKKLNKKY